MHAMRNDAWLILYAPKMSMLLIGHEISLQILHEMNFMQWKCYLCMTKFFSAYSIWWRTSHAVSILCNITLQHKCFTSWKHLLIIHLFLVHHRHQLLLTLEVLIQAGLEILTTGAWITWKKSRNAYTTASDMIPTPADAWTSQASSVEHSQGQSD